MFSPAYYRIVENGKKYHATTKSWNGYHTIPYAAKIKHLANKHNIFSLLDYGCGKGLQYSTNVEWEAGISTTLDKYLHVKEVYKFDPCIEEFSIYPPLEKKFDAVILIQCTGFIPDIDIPILKSQLEKFAVKFCYIGELATSGVGNVKPKKLALLDPDNCSTNRNKDWYQQQFKSWNSPAELIFDWI